MMKRFKQLLKYGVLSFFIMTNALIIVESSLPGSISSQRSNFITNIASFIINGVLPDVEPEIIDVETILVKNHLDEEVIENETVTIPLGVTRRFSASVLPSNATNPNVTWTSSNPSILRVTSGGYLEARQLGEAVRVTVTSTTHDITHSFYVDVVEKSAPTDFEVSLEESTILVGESTRLNVMLDERERREYDSFLLVYTSSNPDVAGINPHGVINALAVGTTEISVSNHEEVYLLTVEENPYPIIKPTTIELSGPAEGYVYGNIQLEWTFDINDLTDNGVTFTSSNEAIATVNHEGLVTGAKVSGTATITVYANADFSISDQIDVTFNEVIPTAISLSSSKLEVDVGTKQTIIPSLSHPLSDQTLPITNQEVIYQSSDPSIAEVTSLNGQGIVLGLKRGVVIITARPQANPAIEATITLTIKAMEVINNNNITEFGAYLRKAVGHFSLFFVNGILGFLTFTFFLTKAKPWQTLVYALIPGLFFAGISEFIQLFVPDRGASTFDVLIDFFGYLVACLILYLGFYVHTRMKKKTSATPIS